MPWNKVWERFRKLSATPGRFPQTFRCNFLMVASFLSWVLPIGQQVCCYCCSCCSKRNHTRWKESHTSTMGKKNPLSHLWIFWTMNCMYRCNFRYLAKKKCLRPVVHPMFLHQIFSTNENTSPRNTLGFTHCNSKFLVKVFGSFYIVLAAQNPELWTPAGCFTSWLGWGTSVPPVFYWGETIWAITILDANLFHFFHAQQAISTAHTTPARWQTAVLVLLQISQLLSRLWLASLLGSARRHDANDIKWCKRNLGCFVGVLKMS